MKNQFKHLREIPDSAINFQLLNRICERAFFQALMMIDVANKRPTKDRGEPKVGGHASACASSQHILGAIHLVLREPADYIACKPHVSPMDHAYNFLLHNFRDKDGKRFDSEKRKLVMHHLRHYSKEGHPVFQSYHAESDPDSYRIFPSGSVGIPPVTAVYTALGYKFADDHKFGLNENPYFWCLMGDSEFREGSLMEAMPDAGERELGNVIWIVDYNRQSLDGTRIANEQALGGSDADRIVRIGNANGWETIQLKHGKKREKLFARPGGEEFRRVLDEKFTDFEFQALLESNNGKLLRKVLLEKSAKLKGFLKSITDEELLEAYTNLAGHDLESLVGAFSQAKQNPKRPTLIVAYTIKGWGLRCQALSGNHSTLPEDDELANLASKINLSMTTPFEDFPKDSEEEKFIAKRREHLLSGIEEILAQTRHRQEHWMTFFKSQVNWPPDFDISSLKFNPHAHTQWMWGQVAAKLDRLARGRLGNTSSSSPPLPTSNEQEWGKVAQFFLTMAPDVGSSTNTSPNMNGKLYGDIEQDDFQQIYGSKDKSAPDIVPNLTSRAGHLRFEITEGNCMSAAGSFGKFYYFTGLPFYPAMTIYDFFIKRAHDQFYYNLYWKASFATIGTPSGVTLAPEGAQHSWKSDFQIPNCITWEPCFAKEVEWILADTLKRHFTGQNFDGESILLRCVTKGLPQKELLERLRGQLRFRAGVKEPVSPEDLQSLECMSDSHLLETIRNEALSGAYPLIDYRGYRDYTPGDNVVHIFAMGALGYEAVKASNSLRERGIYANVFIVTSPDLLLGNYAFKDSFNHLRNNLGLSGDLFLTGSSANEVGSRAAWYSLEGSRVPVVSVHDGEPGLLDNIGSVLGVKQVTLAVRKTSKSGNTADVFHFHAIDSEGISQACIQVLEDTSKERFVVAPEILKSLLAKDN